MDLVRFVPTDAAVDLLHAHMIRLIAQSGQPGTPRFTPRAAAADLSEPARRRELVDALSRPLTELDWRASWVLREVDPTGTPAIRGTVDLIGAKFASMQHRAMLGIGIEDGWRGAGHGRALMMTAIEFALGAGLDWIDLFVVESNPIAHQLYLALGFRETGRVPDSLRFDGESLTDIAMSLRLRP